MVYGTFYEKQDPDSDPVTLSPQPIKIGPSVACFLRGDEECCNQETLQASYRIHLQPGPCGPWLNIQRIG